MLPPPEKVPGAHSTGRLLVSAQLEPAGQVTQTELAPVPSLYEPPAQAMSDPDTVAVAEIDRELVDVMVLVAVLVLVMVVVTVALSDCETDDDDVTEGVWKETRRKLKREAAVHEGRERSIMRGNAAGATTARSRRRAQASGSPPCDLPSLTASSLRKLNN